MTSLSHFIFKMIFPFWAINPNMHVCVCTWVYMCVCTWVCVCCLYSKAFLLKVINLHAAKMTLTKLIQGLVVSQMLCQILFMNNLNPLKYLLLKKWLGHFYRFFEVTGFKIKLNASSPMLCLLELDCQNGGGGERNPWEGNLIRRSRSRTL